MLRFYDILPRWETDPRARMVLQVHDSLWFEVPHVRQRYWLEIIAGLMSEVDGWPVPFPVDVKVIRERNEEAIAA